MGLTQDSKLASSPKKIHAFVQQHGATLGEGEAKLLQGAKLENRHITKLKESNIPGPLKQILIRAGKAMSSLFSFIKNLGATNSSLIKSINSMADQRLGAIEHEKLAEKFEEKLVQEGLSSKLGALVYLKGELSVMKERLNTLEGEIDSMKATLGTLNPQSMEYKSLRHDLDKKRAAPELTELRETAADVESDIASRESALQNPESLAQMQSILDDISPHESDPPHLQSAKERIHEEKSGLIDEMVQISSRQSTMDEVSGRFNEKLGKGDLQEELKALIDLKSTLSTMKERLSSLDPESKEAKELKEDIRQIGDLITDGEKGLRSKDFRKQMREALKECKIADNDSPAVKAAKSKFTKENSALIDQMKALTSITFSESAEIHVVDYQSGEAENFSVPTNFSDRADPSLKKGYSERAEGDMSVRKHVRMHYEEKGEIAPDSSKLGSSVTMDKLAAEKEVSYEQFQSAATNRLWDIALDDIKIFGSKAKEGAGVVGALLNDILQELPNDSIQNLHDLKEALQDRIQDRNVQREMIDLDTFRDMIKGKINSDLYNSPEFKEAIKAYEEGRWLPGQERQISFTQFEADDLKKFMQTIDLFFDDQETLAVLQQFVPLGEAGPQLARDAEALRDAAQLAQLKPQQASLAAKLTKLNQEKEHFESELRVQIELNKQASSPDGKRLTKEKMDAFSKKIGQLKEEISSLSTELDNIQNALAPLLERSSQDAAIPPRFELRQELLQKKDSLEQRANQLGTEQKHLQSELEVQRELNERAVTDNGKRLTKEKIDAFTKKIESNEALISKLEQEISAMDGKLKLSTQELRQEAFDRRAEALREQKSAEINNKMAPFEEQLSQLNKEKEGLEAEIKAQKMLQEKGSADAKGFAKKKIDGYLADIAALEQKMGPFKEAIAKLKSEAEGL